MEILLKSTREFGFCQTKLASASDVESSSIDNNSSNGSNSDNALNDVELDPPIIAERRKIVQERQKYSFNAEDPEKWKQHHECNNLLDEFLNNSPGALFLLDALEEEGCKFNRSRFECTECPSNDFSAHFNPFRGVISICQNQADNRTVIKDAITHELIHAYDNCRINMDYSNCHHIACTEIRAANLGSDCKPSREWKRGNLKLSLSSFLGHKPICVRRRALLSLKAVPHCAKDAESFVDSVFETCYNDLDPFVGLQ